MEMLVADSKIETVNANGELPFEQLVWEKYRNRCCNCGGDHKLRVKLIVPLEAGGREVVSNASLLCRACEMAADTAARRPGERRPINFWVSRNMHDRMTNGMSTSHGLKSMSALVTYLMSMYVRDVDRFDDLERFQDANAGAVKLNVWVPTDQYETFKRLVNQRGMSVTDALKSLIQMFDSEVAEAHHE